jgi:hypothetical protein
MVVIALEDFRGDIGNDLAWLDLVKFKANILRSAGDPIATGTMFMAGRAQGVSAARHQEHAFEDAVWKKFVQGRAVTLFQKGDGFTERHCQQFQDGLAGPFLESLREFRFTLVLAGFVKAFHQVKGQAFFVPIERKARIAINTFAHVHTSSCFSTA